MASVYAEGPPGEGAFWQKEMEMALRLHGWLILVLLGSENGLAEPAVVAP